MSINIIRRSLLFLADIGLAPGISREWRPKFWMTNSLTSSLLAMRNSATYCSSLVWRRMVAAPLTAADHMRTMESINCRWSCSISAQLQELTGWPIAAVLEWSHGTAAPQKKMKNNTFVSRHHWKGSGRCESYDGWLQIGRMNRIRYRETIMEA